jgi:hypothetical protein
MMADMCCLTRSYIGPMSRVLSSACTRAQSMKWPDHREQKSQAKTASSTMVGVSFGASESTSAYAKFYWCEIKECDINISVGPVTYECNTLSQPLHVDQNERVTLLPALPPDPAGRANISDRF